MSGSKKTPRNGDRKSKRKAKGKRLAVPRPRSPDESDKGCRERDPIKAMQEDAERAAVKARILDLMAEDCLTISGAAKQAGVARSTVYTWRDSDPEFAKALYEAYEAGTDALEDMVAARAGTSDYLALEMLRKRRAAWRRNAPPEVAPAMAAAMADSEIILKVFKRLPLPLLEAIEVELEKVRAEDARAAALDARAAK